MLNVMRENLRHLKWILYVVAAALVLSLGLFFSTDRSTGQGVSADWAARIDGRPITSRAFLSEAGSMDAYYRQLLGDQYSQMKPNIRLGSSVIQRMVSQEIMLQEARKLGLTATSTEIADSIRNDPALKDESGEFVGAEVYKNHLNRRYPGGVTAFEANIASRIIVQKWTNLVTASTAVSDAEIEKEYRRRNEKTSIDYILLPKSEQEISSVVPDEEVSAWYASHQEDFLREERRRFRHVVLDRMAWREKVSISDDEIGRFYDENLNTYLHPEERRASHVLFRVTPDMDEDQKKLVRKQAESVHARIAGGESIEPLAKAMSQDAGSARKGGDVGWFQRNRMTAAFDEAAFRTPVGELAPVTETEYGFHVIQVTDSRTEGTTPLEEVREDIRNNLTIRKAHEQVNEEAARLRDAMADAETFTSVAGEEQLEILEMTVTREDLLPELAPTPDLMDNLFELEPGMVAGPFTVSTGQALITLDEVLPPSVAALDEVENEVRAAILDDRMTAAALEAGRTALERRGSLAAAARSLDKEVQESVDLAPGRINLPGSGGHSSELARVLFAEDTVEGAEGVTQVPAGAVVYRVTGRVPFDPDAFEAAREQLGKEVLDAKRARMLDAILTRLWDRYTIEYNEPLIEQANS